MAKSEYGAKDFRAELVKIMPGYSWTVHQSSNAAFLKATGIQSSGSNRLSTLSVVRSERDGKVTYVSKSAGYGTRAKWLHTNIDGTLARSLRGLQDHYQAIANTYRSHAKALENARCAVAEIATKMVTS
jgi:hypothetical protein